MLALAATLVSAGALAAIHASADHPGLPYRGPIGEFVHDLYDRRYRPPDRTPAPASSPQTPGAHQHHGATLSPAQPPAQHHQHHGPSPAGQTPGAQAHGTPPGWKFTLPKGDADKGRAVFVKFECYACHEVKGQTFPGVKDQGNIGPELSEMAPHHEEEFFAEAIANPNALIDEPQWRAPDGTSRMPSFNDSMTVQELVDLVAFLKSLTPPGSAGGHKH
jgi:cytochrome c1